MLLKIPSLRRRPSRNAKRGARQENQRASCALAAPAIKWAFVCSCIPISFIEPPEISLHDCSAEVIKSRLAVGEINPHPLCKPTDGDKVRSKGMGYLVESAPMSDQRRIALTLSGGGFRATLFHLGVVRFLHEAGVLPLVQRIAAVSGGSVLAAHLVLNWQRYNGSSERFDSAAQEILDFVRSDTRGRIVRRWILAWVLVLPHVLGRGYWTLTRLLERQYERLYGKAQLKDLHSIENDARPQVF